MKNEPGIGLLEIVTAVLIMSFSGVLMRLAGISSGTMAFVRTAVPSLILGLWLYIRSRRSGNRGAGAQPRKVGILLLASLLNAVRLWMFFEAFRRTTIGNAVIVLYSWPVFAMIYGAFLLEENFTARDLILMFLAFAGMTIVYSGGGFSLGNNDFVGMSLMLLSAVIYALVIILIRKEKVERLQATFWQNLVGAIVFLPSFVMSVSGMTLNSWFWAGMNGFVVGTFAFTLFFSALNRLPAAVVGHIAYLEVVFSLLWGVMIFREPVDWRHITGGGLIILSMLIRAEIRRRRSI